MKSSDGLEIIKTNNFYKSLSQRIMNNFLKKNCAIVILSILLQLGAISYSSATHISKPILLEPKTDYVLGEKIVVNGWVNYNDHPTADVLLNFKVLRPDGLKIVDESLPSDKKGHFKFEVDTHNQIPGIYQIIITSHCQEIHRQVCTYQSHTLSVNVNKKS